MAPPRVLLAGWDAADWKVIHPLMKAGRMPNLQRLIKSGASGPIATLHPPLSPMLWTSIATGKRPFQHGILGFTEPTANGRGVQPVTNLSRKSKAVWNILQQNGLRSTVIGWWPSHPAEPIDGVMVSDHYHRASRPLEDGWPLTTHSVHPPELAEALAAVRVHPDVLEPRMVERFVPLAREIDQDRDKRLALLLRTIAECMSIQAAALWLVEHRPWDFFAVYYDSIDHFCHGFMKYHPPRQSWIDERDFELYRGVIAMAYQFHDEMLGALLAKADEDTTVMVVSDHGFHPDHLRPSSIPDIPAGPAIEHRDYGILTIRGPGVRHGELHGASVLDIAPTILTVYGLQVGEDMDGKVLSAAFAESPRVAFISSWEEVAGADGRHPAHTRIDPLAAHAALEQMIALGYIEPPDENRKVAVEKTVRELRYNLGEAYQDGDRHLEAHRIFSELYMDFPDEPRFAVRLFVSAQALGRQEEMRRIVEELERRESPVSDYLAAQVLTSEKRYEEALTALERVNQSDMLRPGLFLQTGDLYLRLGRLGDAQRVYEQAVAADPDNAHAHLGLCRVALRRRQFDAAARSALETIERIHHYPLAHFLLGRALVGMREYARAAGAFRAAISFNPNFPEAHLRLARLLDKHPDDAESAREHRRLARAMRTRGWTPLPETRPAAQSEAAVATEREGMPPPEECVVIVTGLPRSGTSMLMQMLAGGGLSPMSDRLREADDDNPRGYLEFEPVKNLLQNAAWLHEARGKAVKIVAPLLRAVPADLPCMVILSERDLDEVLDSQDRMLARRDHAVATPERRRMLKHEYRQLLERVKAALTQRPRTQLLVIEHGHAMSHPRVAAETMNRFLGGALDVEKMATAIDPALYRNRAPASGT
jgi:predicted AlkP superfamily phosphohydrolase/phosphomutase/tetratricopeptide (TPR) repeat protein